MKTFDMAEDAYTEAAEDNEGRCIACGAEAYGVEPDARNYTCEECGKDMVFGMEELMLMGRIMLEDD